MLRHSQKANQNDFFLPDFCQVQSVFLVILIAELLAVIFTLINVQPQTSLWNSLGIYSISVQLVTLFSVSALCLLRPVLAKFNDWIAGALSLLIILTSTSLFSFAVIYWYWLMPLDMSDPRQTSVLLRNLFLSGLIGSVALRYFYLQLQYRKQLSAEASARLEALQARIRPHFLFNSMNVIASLTRIDAKKAEIAIQDLCDLFRATLNNRQDLIPFAQELENGERYLAIEKLRLGDRLTIEIQVQESALQVLVPPLSVQPLLENAVYHGIQMLPEGGCIKLHATVDEDLLSIIVTNPRTDQPNRGGHGMALSNISQRLAVIYADKAKLSRESDHSYYRVIMRIPVSITEN